MSHPTIHDVAERAGVSKSLVSLVMRDASNVSDAKRVAVKKAAAELGYRPNAAAKNLVRGRSFVIGALVSDLHNPFFADVVDGIDEAAKAGDYRTLIASGFRSPKREAVSIDTLLQLRVDGIILAGTTMSTADINVAAKSAPLVLISRPIKSPAVDSVTVNDRKGAEMAVDHLVSLGHKKIAHIHGGTGAGAKQRLSGYESAMKRHKLTTHISSARGDFTEEGGYTAMQSLLKGRKRPTAVFAANDFSALGALSAAQEAQLAVPDDLSIIGYDNTSLSQLSHIGLTTIDQPRDQLASEAVRLLFERIDGRTKAEHLVVAPSLVQRTTTQQREK